MRLLPLLLVVCVIGAANGINFNIFRWPSFNRNKGGGGGGGGYGSGGGGGGGGGFRIPGPLRGLKRLKSQAFTSLRNLKAPIIEGIRNLKSQVLDFKGSLFAKAGNLFNKGNEGGGGQSSYYRRPPSHYGSENSNNGYFEISYQAPSAPSTGYGAPQAPSSSYGAPQAQSSGFTSPQAPSSSYGAPQAQSPGFTSPQAPSSSYGAPQAPVSNFGAQQAPPSSYSSPRQPNNNLAALQATGFREPTAPSGSGYSQTGSTGFRPSAPAGTGIGNPAPLQNSFLPATGQQAGAAYNTQANSAHQQHQSQINAPLSAAMAMGHLLNEDEVIKGTGQAQSPQWRPIVGNTGVAPGIDVRAPASVSQVNAVQNTVQYTGSQTTPVGPTATQTPVGEPLFIDLDGSGGIDIGATSPGSQAESSDPIATVNADDTLFISATEDYDDILLVDKGSPDVAAQALAKVVDAALLINEGTDNNEVVGPRAQSEGKSLTGSRLQEDVVLIEQTNDIGATATRTLNALHPGQNSNMMFSGLMEELKLNTLMALIRRANLEAMLTTEGGFTIFAPTDAAFTLLPRSAVAQLQNNTEKLREVVLFHVIPGAVKLDDLRNNIMLNSASPKGRKLRVNVYQHGNDDETVITVNGARIRRHDMIATNGVIHVIDRVLYPMADLSIIDHLTTCETFTGANVAVTGAGLTPVLDREGPYTVFLPTTEAFAAIDNATVSSFIQNITMLQNVLMYHILPGAYFSEGLRDGMWLPTMAEQELQVRLTSDGYTRRLAGVGIAAKVLKHDIIAKNGVIHVIDTVLRPEKEEPICGHF
ncbi:uncharacterized protein [Palaemon carinicauda]|uniref:uncharacterized protein n=1 Tax=Palaemon carinicauda TaxID=392227 RepID=UPI0035B66EBD